MGRGNRNKTGRLELNFEGWAKVSWMKEEEKKIIHKVWYIGHTQRYKEL